MPRIFRDRIGTTKLSLFLMSVAMLAVFCFAAAPSASAQTIEVAYITSLPNGATSSTEGSSSWTYDSLGGIYIYYFKNNTGSAWTGLTISAVVGGSTTNTNTFTDNQFNLNNFQSITNANFLQAFVTASAPSPGSGKGGSTVTMTDSGITLADPGVPAGDYLAVRFNGWPTAVTGPPAFPDTVFTFTATEAPAPAPEPMSYLLFGSGLLFLGVISRKKLGLGRG